MKLLIKFPTRNRVDKFMEVLKLHNDMVVDKDNTHFLITCDNDDVSMNNDGVRSRIKSMIKNVDIEYFDNKTKIEACNAGLSGKVFDILMLTSDDMYPKAKGFDNLLRELFRKNMPDLNGVIWLNDGYQGHRLNTLPIMGVNYYKRFNYVYHPSYKSLYCDTEFTDVMKTSAKYAYVQNVLVEHRHPVRGFNTDELYKKNDKFENEDRDNYNKRKANGFKN